MRNFWLRALHWSHVNWDVPHVKFIGEKQTLLSYSVPRVVSADNKAHILMSSKPERNVNCIEYWGCFVLPVGQTKLVSFTLNHGKTLVSYETQKPATSTFAAVINPNIFLIFVAKLSDWACWWIVQTDESWVRTVKWVMSWWRMALIHYSWAGWAECKWQWQTETLLPKCINCSRVLDLIFEGLIGILDKQE